MVAIGLLVTVLGFLIGLASLGLTSSNGVRLVMVLAGILVSSLIYSIPAQAQGTRIVHISDGFSDFPYAVINRSGVVAFSARLTSPAVGRGIYKGSGGGRTTVLEYKGAPGEIMPLLDGQFRMNDAGSVCAGLK